MLTVLFLLALTAFITTIVSAAGHRPLYVPVLLMSIYLLLLHIPK